MKTTAKNKKVRIPEITNDSSPAGENILKDAEYKHVRTDDILFSPLNYRKYFSEEALQSFAEELRQHGIISPVTVRKLASGKYELVAGERRVRAARTAGLETVPAAIVSLTDEQVTEIQLAENLQRENPHPMHEAQAIGQMQRTGKTIDEIAARLGKSKQFVYTRLKLLNLVESFQVMLLADAISLQDALQIATLSAASQTEFFDEHCRKWEAQKNFRLDDLEYYLNHYRYDLKKAPFNTKDKKLAPEAGPCTTCPSNSGTLKTLFPEYSKTAVCSNKECYNNKCLLHFVAGIREAMNTYGPAALLYYNELTEMGEKMVALVPGASELPRYNYHEVSVITKPECADKEDFTYNSDDDEPELDEEEFSSAMENYYRELEVYNLHRQSGHYQVALLLDNSSFEPVYFNPEKPKQFTSGRQAVTAKKVQAAIKSGDATPELLQAEIERIEQREKRAEELDREKVQLTVHKALSEYTGEISNNVCLTDADLLTARLIVYQSLDYHTKRLVEAVIFPPKGEESGHIPDEVFNSFKNMSDQQLSFLIRMAICSKSDSKMPTSDEGYFLCQIAIETGLPVQSIEDAQNIKATERKKKVETKIKELGKKIKKLAKTVE